MVAHNSLQSILRLKTSFVGILNTQDRQEAQVKEVTFCGHKYHWNQNRVHLSMISLAIYILLKIPILMMILVLIVFKGLSEWHI